MLIIPYKDRKLLNKTHLFNYYFDWGPRDQPSIALGYGSLYNHSYHPNAKYVHLEKKKMMKFVAINDIKKDEEILVNYNYDPKAQEKVWFDKGKK